MHCQKGAPTHSPVRGVQGRGGGVLTQAHLRAQELLLVGKLAACVTTARISPVIVATLVDSAIDVLIQCALYWANRLARPEERAASISLYPAGRG